MWTDFVGESSFLVEVFDRAPSLANVRIEEVALARHGAPLLYHDGSYHAL